MVLDIFSVTAQPRRRSEWPIMKTLDHHRACGVNAAQTNDTFVVCPSELRVKPVQRVIAQTLSSVSHTHIHIRITAFRSLKQACSVAACHKFLPVCVAVLTAQRVSLAC